MYNFGSPRTYQLASLANPVTWSKGVGMSSLFSELIRSRMLAAGPSTCPMQQDHGDVQ